jgi:hypothetical protein
MRRRLHTLAAGVALAAIVTGALVSCGGGGYGGSSSSSAGGGMYSGTPMPTVTFNSPTTATTVNFGQAVQLAWSASNASSCTASVSSAMGGGFTGAQASSGEAMVAPTGPGMVTYTLSCSGAGGMASATSATVTVNPSILSVLAPQKITTIG